MLLGKGENLSRDKARKNLIQIQVQKDHSQDQEHYQYGISQLEYKHITTYDLSELIRIKHVVANDIRYKQPSFGTARSIHKLKLNRWERGSRGGRKTYQTITIPIGVKWTNLRILPHVPNKRVKHKGKLGLMLLNTQLIKNKEVLHTDYMRCEVIDMAVVTET